MGQDRAGTKALFGQGAEVHCHVVVGAFHVSHCARRAGARAIQYYAIVEVFHVSHCARGTEWLGVLILGASEGVYINRSGIGPLERYTLR